MSGSGIVLTRGAVELRALANQISGAEVARRTNTSPAMISQIASGKKMPGDALKAALALLGVAVDGWTMPVVPDAGPRTTPATDMAARRVKREQRAESLRGDVERDSAIARLVESIAELEELIEIARGGMAPITHVAALMRVKVTALDRLANLRGEGELTIAAIRRSKAWQELLDEMGAVLVDHPEAARALEKAFEKFG